MIPRHTIPPAAIIILTWKLFCFARFWKVGTDGQHVWKKPAVCIINISFLSASLETSQQDTLKNVFLDIEVFIHEDRVGSLDKKKPMGQPFTGENITEEADQCFKWNLYNSVFFSFTAVTTIGKNETRWFLYMYRIK